MERPKWNEMRKQEKVFWIATYSLVGAMILILGAWLVQLIGVGLLK